jgi:TPP-dependent indolepyruvate ferredoxin oxidoreductase alpha subunit
MAIRIRCPNGHLLKIKEKYAGRTGMCPRCRRQVRVPTLDELYDEQIIAVLDKPRAVDTDDEPTDRHVLDEPTKDESGVSLLGASAVRKPSICPHCQHRASFSFSHCPRCGTLLPGRGDCGKG